MSPPDMLAWFRRTARNVNRRMAYERLQAAYDTYRAKPENGASAFGALRALLKWCQLHGMTGMQARLFAELGRVDDEAPAPWQLTLARRRPTRPMRERLERDRKRDKENRREARSYRRFVAVLDLLDKGETLEQAFPAVAAREGMITAETVRQDWLRQAKLWRDLGRVEFREEGHWVKLPGAGRRK